MKDIRVHSLPGTLALDADAPEKLAEIAALVPAIHVFIIGPVRRVSYDLAFSIRQSHGNAEAAMKALEDGQELWNHLVYDRLGKGKASGSISAHIASNIATAREILHVLDGSLAFPGGSDRYVDALGSHWAAEICRAAMKQKGMDVVLVDYPQALRKGNSILTSPIVLIYGDIRGEEDIDVSTDPDGETLAEHAASRLGPLLGAGGITFWNGHAPLRTADIREVPGARVIDELSFSEAVELSYFGAPVVHPRSLLPASGTGLPVRLSWWNDIQGPCTVVRPMAHAERIPESTVNGRVKGFSIIHDVALINIEGTGMSGVPGISSRLFSTMRDGSISVSFISQASSEYSICFAVAAVQAQDAMTLAHDAFRHELSLGLIQRIDSEPGCAILAVVGDRMSGTPGIAARVFSSLSKVGVNVRAIAQGSSERNISAVIKDSDSTRALQGLHAGIFLSRRTLSVGIFGLGGIGSTLLEQLRVQSERLHEEFGVDIRIRAMANSTRMLLDEEGVDLDTWKERFKKDSVLLDTQKVIEHVTVPYFPHAVIFDCSASGELPRNYVSWLEKGAHIITPNKKAGAGPYGLYDKLMKTCRSTGRRFLYEATVGAGLPVISTLQDLVRTGDRVHRIEGIVSGTLAWLFSQYDGSKPFSSLVREAREMGYTEPDPRDDLSGMDVARKTVILARELGYTVETADLQVTSLVPEQLCNMDVPLFMARLQEMDVPMEKLFKEAEARGEKLRYVGQIDGNGRCSVSLNSYPAEHPFAQTVGTNNVICFTTDRYHEFPLVITGPGAGKEVTAGGVFADLLRLCAYLGARL
ncbi:bifunctional aspartate kinase/homoserine dehydrogenase I [Parasphaerochaeta coccoides]|uniref:Aspartate kinase., Homoserine dehydrogenase n=1 Tax=Parasphaerochaeta coccoides (strain ATCC BAA-1237 / DSM 17374 / SPN1) TaxID=760011 RepID=F4GIE9_PARC1|nr:bifunctional aspartate kinase/homoserine dehydrogenase I [Parasphaerochaeta coccoides]AEC01657.1 Aspartate kinase., Homoserine dehydrogenase [Parasphaerochaeta coccoides DSM 17374]